MNRLPAWASWLVGRSLAGVLTTLALSAIVFLATQALPSDPARVILGPEATDESVATLTRQLGLDAPLHEQYGAWLGRVVRGDLGLSMNSRRPVAGLVLERTVGTLGLVACVMPTTLLISILLGVFLAVRKDSLLDRATVSTLVAIKAVPVFATGIALIMLFSTSVFSVLPAVSLIDTSRSLLGQLEYLVLPAATLVLSSAPYLVRLVRGSMIDTLTSEYVLQARLRGIPEWRVRYLHALPNALIPVIQGAALTASVMLSGAIVVEVLFNYPGLGSLLNQAVEGRDLPIVQASVLIIASVVVAVNLAADLLTVFLTPKLRTRGRPRPGTEPEGAPIISADRAHGRGAAVVEPR